MIVTLSKNEWRSVYRQFQNRLGWNIEIEQIVSLGSSVDSESFSVDMEHKKGRDIGELLSKPNFIAISDVIDELSDLQSTASVIWMISQFGT